MTKLKLALCNALNMIKGFDTGYTSRNSNAFLLDYNGKRYRVSLVEIENPDKDMFKDIDRFL